MEQQQQEDNRSCCTNGQKTGYNVTEDNEDDVESKLSRNGSTGASARWAVHDNQHFPLDPFAKCKTDEDTGCETFEAQYVEALHTERNLVGNGPLLEVTIDEAQMYLKQCLT